MSISSGAAAIALSAANDSDLSEPESPNNPSNKQSNKQVNNLLLNPNNLSSSQTINQTISDSKPNFIRARTSTVPVVHRQSITQSNPSNNNRACPSTSTSTYKPLFASPKKTVNQPILQSNNPSFSQSSLTPSAKKKNQLAARLNFLVTDLQAHDSDRQKVHHETSDIHEPLLQLVDETIKQSNASPNTNNRTIKRQGSKYSVFPLSPSNNQTKNQFNQTNNPFAADFGDWKPYDAKAHAKLMAPPVNQTINQSNKLSNKQAINQSIDEQQDSGILSFDDASPSWKQSIKQSLTRIVHRPSYQYFSIFLTLLSLYLFDTCMALSINQSGKRAISIVLTLVLAFFLVDLAVNCSIKKKYLFSFFFFLDLIGCLSLLFDIDFIVDAIFNQSINQSSGSNDRIQHTASIVRLTRFARILRVLRLVRIVRLFRYHLDISVNQSDSQSINQSNNQSAGQAKHASKVGMHLTELMDKRVILMVLSTILITPFLTADPVYDDQSINLGLELIIDSVSIDSLIDCLIIFINTHPTLFYVMINTPATRSFYQAVNQTNNQSNNQSISQAGMITFLDLRSQYDDLRSDERDMYQINQTISQSINQSNNETNVNQATLIFSTRPIVVDTAVSSLLTTTLVIVVFLIGSLIISRQIDRLIVQPLDRMTNILRKLAGTVCFLTNFNQPNQSVNQSVNIDEDNEQLETTIIEQSINQLATIFSVEPDQSVNQPKPLQMLAGSKTTEIITQNSIVEIQVIERPKISAPKPIIDDSLISDDRSQWIDVDLSLPEFSDFASVEMLLSNNQITPYLYAYLEDCFVSENLLFTQQVDRFRSIMIQHAVNLYNSFISSRAPTQINIPHSIKQSIISQLTNPSIDIFEEAQKECMSLMESHWSHFLQSKYGRRAYQDLEEQEKRRARIKPSFVQSINQSNIQHNQSNNQTHHQTDKHSTNLLEVPHQSNTQSNNQTKHLVDHELKPSSDEDDLHLHGSVHQIKQSNNQTNQAIKKSILINRTSRSVSSLPSVDENEDEDVKPLIEQTNKQSNNQTISSARKDDDQVKKSLQSKNQSNHSFNQSRVRSSSESLGQFPGAVNED